MNSEDINDLLNSSFDCSSFDEFDDSDEDPDWGENNIQNLPFGSTSSNERNVNVISTNGDALSGIHILNEENDDSSCDLFSHLIDSSSDTRTSYVRRTGPRQWRDDDGTTEKFIYDPDGSSSGINPDLFDTMIGETPIEFYKLIVSDDILNNIVLETNRYAAQQKASKLLSPFSRLTKWTDTDITEISQLFGLLLWTGLVRLPSYELYWSNSPLFSTNFGKVMSRNRFEILLQMLHFADNSVIDKTNRLFKLGSVIDDILQNSNNCMQPTDSLCIDESLVKFMGRLSFKQYIPNKSDRFGIKEFKLCIPPCYTIGMKVYAGKEANPTQSVGTKVVMELSEPYLDNGRTLFVDNWYSSVELAELLQSRKTYIVGTLRSNRKSNPVEVTKKKIKKGEVVSMRSDSNVLVLKWKDKRDLHMISTKHNSEMVENIVKGKVVSKPKVVVNYNVGKTPIDLSDQMSSYSNPLRRSTKWYRKVVLDSILNIAVINSLVLYNAVNSSKLSVTNFRAALVEQLILIETTIPINLEIKHQLDVSGKSRCFKCYSKMSLEKGRVYAQSHSRKTQTKCLACNKFYCTKCFYDDHKIINK